MANVPVAVDLAKYIDTTKFGERPHVRGRRLPIAVIAYSVGEKGWNIADLAYEFTLTEAEVLAALLYYQEHKVEIDAQEATEQTEKDEMFRRYGNH